MNPQSFKMQTNVRPRCNFQQKKKTRKAPKVQWTFSAIDTVLLQIFMMILLPHRVLYSHTSQQPSSLCLIITNREAEAPRFLISYFQCRTIGGPGCRRAFSQQHGPNKWKMNLVRFSLFRIWYHRRLLNRIAIPL